MSIRAKAPLTAFGNVAPSFVAMGYKPVPIMPGTKSPGTCSMGRWKPMPAWQAWRDKPFGQFDIKIWSSWPEAGIGIVLGSEVEPGWVVIALDHDTDDLDILDRIATAVPPSPVMKRGRRGFTGFYLAPTDTATQRFRCGAETVFEILAGHGTRQTVCPPSVHPETGRPYEWMTTGTLGTVPAAALPRLTEDDMARLVDTVESIPGVVPAVEVRVSTVREGDGNASYRAVNDAALSNLPAWVPQLGLPKLKQTSAGFVGVPFWRPNRMGLSTEQRNPSLSFSYQGIKDNSAGHGMTAIDVVMAAHGIEHEASYMWLAQRLGMWIDDDGEWAELSTPKPNQAVTVALPPHDPETGEIIGEPADNTVNSGKLENLDDLIQIPGLLGDVVEWIVDTARYPNRVLALGAAITLIGTLMGRRVAGPTMSGTHLYVLALAPSGAGKDHALRRLPQLLAAASASHLTGPSQFMSMTSLTQLLAEEPLCLASMDEFGAYIAKLTNPRSSPHEKAISGILREAWGASFEMMPLPRWANTKSTIVESPALSLYGASTPEEFFDALQSKDVINGFLNRFLILTTDKVAKDRDPPLSKGTVPPKLAADLAAFYQEANANGPNDHAKPFGGAPRQMEWADEAARLAYERVKTTVEPLRDDEEVGPFYARTAEMAVRLATIRAAGQKINGTVSESDIEWGAAVAINSARQAVEAASSNLAPNEFARQGNGVINFLKKRKGPSTRRDLSRQLRELTSRDLDAVLQKLIESGRIEEESPPAVKKPGAGRPPSAKLYRLAPEARKAA